jgi:uncharacterized Fe-S cluster-containing radical SAM superfamily protein
VSSAAKPIDTAKFATHLRSRAIDVPNRRLLISRLAGSEQEEDLSAPVNCGGYGRVRHFKLATAGGWPANPLPIVPACRALGLPVPSVMQAQVFQNAACAWRCWYCFVPDDLLSANRHTSDWFTPEQLVALYTQEANRPVIIDLSGGSPDLVPEWTPWMMEALTAAGLADSSYLWTDDNLSTTYLFDCLDSAQIDRVRSYRNYGRVCCFKGYDRRSFAFNTRAAESDYDRQFEVMQRLLALGIDIYGYVTLTSPHVDGVREGVCDLLDRMQMLDANLPLRVVPLQIRMFAPVGARLERDEARVRSMAIQEEAIAVWNAELRRRFTEKLRSLDVASVPLVSRGAR